MSKTKEWLTKTLLEWPGSKVKSISEHDNFIESEILDSFGLIVFVEETEKKYGIKFDDKDFQDRRFPTIAGLTELIDEKLTLQRA